MHSENMSHETPIAQTAAKQIFSKASPEHQNLIREILSEDRDVRRTVAEVPLAGLFFSALFLF